MTDGVWWFFLFWLPAYLKAQNGMVEMDVAFPLVVLYMLSSIGSITGGWFPMYFLKKRYEPYEARMKARLTIVLFPLAVLSAQYFGVYRYWLLVLIIGIGGIFVNKCAGWIFDGYRHAGIATSWLEAKAANLGDYVDNIRALHLVNKHGDVINLDKVELGGLPAEVLTQVQSIDPSAFTQLQSMQNVVVHGNMTTAYTIVFVFCALAYLIAWWVRHLLVPKFKKIDI